MEGRQSIYYSLGILAYAIAKADGEIQEEEMNALSRIVKKELDHDIDFDYAEIIFQLLSKDPRGGKAVYEWAIHELEKGRHYLTMEIKAKMISTLEKVADAFNNRSTEEKKLIDRFRNDIGGIGSSHPIG